MKKTITIFGAIIFVLFILPSCGGGTSTDVKDLKEKTDSIATATNVEVPVEKEAPSSIKNVQITYKETNEDGSSNGWETYTLTNKGNTPFNGCSKQEFKELRIEGIAKKISIVIKDSEGKVTFEKLDFDLDGSISFTKKDIKDIFFESILIKQKETILFNHETTISGCN